MKKWKKKHIILIALAILVLVGSIGATAYLLFSNYQIVSLFKQAKENFQRGDAESLLLAETQLLQFVSRDSDSENAYILLGAIAEKQKNYYEQVYYCYMAHRLNPLSAENKAQYIRSLCYARFFDRLENFLGQQTDLSDKEEVLLAYAAGRNGRINKYKKELKFDGALKDLTILLFKSEKLSVAEKLAALEKIPAENDFIKQEISVAKAELYLAGRDFDKTGEVLKSAYALNEFAFAPPLGRFYAKYRTFGEALEVFEKYLSTYHDSAVAIQTAEIYCLLAQTNKIAELRKRYQSDNGNSGMLCCYYFDALTALVKNDIDTLKELTVPLRKNINTPLAVFMYLCVDLQGQDISAILSNYSALVEQRSYLHLQKKADSMVLNYLKQSLADIGNNEEKLLALAQKLYSRQPEVFTAKYILLLQKKRNSTSIALLNNALEKFSDDYGIIKIGIEYYLNHSLSESERLIELYKKKFPKRSSDMKRYEIVLALKKKNFDAASKLFQKHFSDDILPEYWIFASTSMREDDLKFLSQDKLYEPFCQALIHLKKNEVSQACDLLEKTDAGNNHELLFFAAKTLAENGRNQAALAKYALFPQNSPYKITVLLNTAELHAENGNLTNALDLARQAYNSAPHMPETQLCYADKLYKKGDWSIIPDIVKLSPSNSFRRRVEPLWVAGMEQRIKDCNINTQREKIRELCRQLLVIAPENNIALEYLKKLHQMPQ